MIRHPFRRGAVRNPLTTFRGKRYMNEKTLLLACIAFSFLELALAWHTTGPQLNDRLRATVEQVATE